MLPRGAAGRWSIAARRPHRPSGSPVHVFVNPLHGVRRMVESSWSFHGSDEGPGEISAARASGGSPPIADCRCIRRPRTLARGSPRPIRPEPGFVLGLAGGARPRGLQDDLDKRVDVAAVRRPTPRRVRRLAAPGARISGGSPRRAMRAQSSYAAPRPDRRCNERIRSVGSRAVAQGSSIDRGSQTVSRARRASRSPDHPQCRG